MSEGAPEGMFNFEHEPEVSNSEIYEETLSFTQYVYGPDPHPIINDVSVRNPSQPKPKQLNVGKILRKFELDSRSYLHAAMRTNYLSVNPTENDVTWEAYRSWMNSKISKLKNFGYKASKRNSSFGFVPLMELWKLRHAPLCIPASEVKEVAKEDSGYPEFFMEDVVAHPDTSEEQQIVVYENQQSAKTSSWVVFEVLLNTIVDMQAKSALVKERLDRQEIIF